MADFVNDGFVKVYSVVTIANIAAPTTAELNAGTNLGSRLTRDGLQGFTPEAGVVDTTAINSTYGTTKPGLLALDKGLLLFKASDGTDTILSTFVYNFVTNIVIRRDGHAETTAWATSDRVEVWPVTIGALQHQDFESNTLVRFGVEVLFHSSPNQRAVVA